MNSAPRARRGAEAEATTSAQAVPYIPHLTSYRLCRRCRLRARPVVPVGSSRWFDLCVRCAGRASREQVAA